MSLKRIAAILFTAALILTVTACSKNNRTGPSVSPAEGAPNTAGAGISAADKDSSPATVPGSSLPSDSVSGVHTASDENVMVNVDFDRDAFTVNDMIGMKVTITNTSDKDIVFLKGSGSNRVPDALGVDFGDFINTYTPEAATKDYQTETLKAGESVSYDLPHAPYTYSAAPDGTVNPGGAFDATIDHFQADGYTPAEAGEKSGVLTFRYLVADESTGAVPDFDSEAVRTVTVPFTANIIA